MPKIKYTNKSILNFDFLEKNHNLGKISDKQFDTFQDALLHKNNVSCTSDCYLGVLLEHEYLSFDYREFIPVTGNRISKNGGIYHYLVLNNGLIVKKTRL